MRGTRRAKRGGFFFLCDVNHTYLFLKFVGASSLALTALISVSICENTMANFGLLFCILLLLASARSSASMMILVSSALNICFLRLCLIAQIVCIIVCGLC